MFRQFVVTLVAMLALAQPSLAQLSKATQIILNRGIELQSLVQYNDIFTLSTYTNANYTSVLWSDPGWQQFLGPAPGFPWGRWVSGPSDMPPQDPYTQYGFNNETNYISQLIDLELGDELNLNDGPTLTNEINWFNSTRSNYPNTILYINNYAGQISDQNLGIMISQGHCDMICFDEYPFQSAYDTNYTNNIGPPNAGPYLSWLGQLWRYRQFGIGYGIPFATYMQTFHSVEDYDQIVYRNPSPSELRYNNSAALAFNAKMLLGFEYNAGATSLFDILPNGYSGDTYTNALYGEQTDVNHRAQILGRTLACLQPVYDLHNASDTNPPPGPASAYSTFRDGTTTSMMILKSNPGKTNASGEPPGSSFVDSPGAPGSYSWWEYQKNDPYLNGWTVTNTGTNNAGLPGQVILSWFRVLDENLDGPAYSNEVYIMVVNALTANSGTSADCAQTIKLNFVFGSSGISNVVMIDPESGLLTTNGTTVISGTKRQLALNLNGGDAALFKYDDGAPFVGHVRPAVPSLTASRQNGKPAITVTGTPLARYQLQSSPAPGGPDANWSVVSNCLFTNASAVFVDSSAPLTNAVFYRAVGIP
jgi:hypothetical protein